MLQCNDILHQLIIVTNFLLGICLLMFSTAPIDAGVQKKELKVMRLRPLGGHKEGREEVHGGIKLWKLASLMNANTTWN